MNAYPSSEFPDARPTMEFVHALFIDSSTEKILLLKRSSGSKHQPDVWQLPGGKIEQFSNRVTNKHELEKPTEALVRILEKELRFYKNILHMQKYEQRSYDIIVRNRLNRHYLIIIPQKAPPSFLKTNEQTHSRYNWFDQKIVASKNITLEKEFHALYEVFSKESLFLQK